MSWELEEELRQSFSTDVEAAREALLRHPWLIIPDLNLDWLQRGYQGCYRDVAIDDGPPADFAMHFHLQGRLYLQFTRLVSPTSGIYDENGRAQEFSSALEEIRCWHQVLNEGQTLLHSLLRSQRVEFSFRILIGLSSKSSSTEKMEVESHRRRHYRIRSYDWLIEKGGRFSADEIEGLDACGPAKTEPEMVSLFPQMMKMLDGPMPPYFRN